MAERLKINKFLSYSHEDDNKVLSDFEAFFNIKQDRQRKNAVLQLHLEGPAMVWYKNLEQDIKDSYSNVLQEFKGKFVWGNTASLLCNTEKFSIIALCEQPLEQYFSKIMNP